MSSIRTVELLQALYARKKHVFFAGVGYDLNLFGIRRAPGVNLFNDLLGCAYRESTTSPLQVELWPGTTDPGSYHLRQPGAQGGTAIVVPGQYRGLWGLGKHRGEHPAFVQVKNIAVFRDGDRDDELDMDPRTTKTGLFGINGHRAGEDSVAVDKWSAGCQVWKRRADHDRALELARKQLDAHPTWTSFTYTLFDVADLALAEALFFGL